MKTKVLALLKPKTVELGFTKEELEGVAEMVAKDLKEDTADEDINASIEAVIPLLKLTQTAVNRIVNAKKREAEYKPAPTGSSQEPTKGANNSEDKLDQILVLVKNQQTEIDDLKNKNVGDQRRVLFEKRIEGLLPKQREDMMNDFNLISPSLKTEEEFNAYLSTKESSVASIKQELANEGLAKMSPPTGGGQTISEQDEFSELLTEINKRKDTST